MAYVFAYPGDEAVIHAAYRPLIYDMVNDHAIPGDATGVQIELHIIYAPQGSLSFTSDYVTLVSRKKVYDVLGSPVYRFDISGIVKDYFGYSYSEAGAPCVAQYNRECEMVVGLKMANMYYSAGMEQTDTLAGSAALITVVNASLRHEGFHAFAPGQRHFTMQDYCYYPTGNTHVRWLTEKPEMCYTSIGYSESLCVLADYADAVQLTFWEGGAAPVAIAVQRLQPVSDFGGGLLLGVHQRIPIGPVNINNTTAWFQSIGMPVVTDNTTRIEIKQGRLYPMGVGGYGFVPFDASLRKYLLRKHCYEYARVHFMNVLGAMDTADMVLDGGKVAAKSVKYERANAFPYRHIDWGMQRLNVDRTETFTLKTDQHELYSTEESFWLSHMVATPFCLVQLGGTDGYAAVVVSDGNMPFYIEGTEDKPGEIDITLCNKLPVQRL
jgi:hypothetical protein